MTELPIESIRLGKRCRQDPRGIDALAARIKDRGLFGWSEDEVATTWEEWRKTNVQYREAYRQQPGLPPASSIAPE